MTMKSGLELDYMSWNFLVDVPRLSRLRRGEL